MNVFSCVDANLFLRRKKKKKDEYYKKAVSYGFSHEAQTKIGLKSKLKLPGMDFEL